MTRIDWIMNKNLDADSPMDFYDFYDSYCDEFNRVPFETYKRYCREAYKQLFSTEAEQIKSQINNDELIVSMKNRGRFN